MLQGIKDTSYQGHLNGFLTSIRGVNKTDVARFVNSFSHSFPNYLDFTTCLFNVYRKFGG